MPSSHHTQRRQESLGSKQEAKASPVAAHGIKTRIQPNANGFQSLVSTAIGRRLEPGLSKHTCNPDEFDWKETQLHPVVVSWS